MQTTTKKTVSKKIKGLSTSGVVAYGFKYRYLPPFQTFVQGGPGNIVSVHPNSADIYEPEDLHDTQEEAAKAVRAMFIEKLEALIGVRDKYKMWNSSHDPREVMVDGLRLLQAGVDMDSAKILLSLDTLPPMR